MDRLPEAPRRPFDQFREIGSDLNNKRDAIIYRRPDVESGYATGAMAPNAQRKTAAREIIAAMKESYPPFMVDRVLQNVREVSLRDADLRIHYFSIADIRAMADRFDKEEARLEKLKTKITELAQTYGWGIAEIVFEWGLKRLNTDEPVNRIDIWKQADVELRKCVKSASETFELFRSAKTAKESFNARDFATYKQGADVYSNVSTFLAFVENNQALVMCPSFVERSLGAAKQWLILGLAIVAIKFAESNSPQQTMRRLCLATQFLVGDDEAEKVSKAFEPLIQRRSPTITFEDQIERLGIALAQLSRVFQAWAGVNWSHDRFADKILRGRALEDPPTDQAVKGILIQSKRDLEDKFGEALKNEFDRWRGQPEAAPAPRRRGPVAAEANLSRSNANSPVETKSRPRGHSRTQSESPNQRKLAPPAPPPDPPQTSKPIRLVSPRPPIFPIGDPQVEVPAPDSAASAATSGGDWNERRPRLRERKYRLAPNPERDKNPSAVPVNFTERRRKERSADKKGAGMSRSKSSSEIRSKIHRNEPDAADDAPGVHRSAEARGESFKDIPSLKLHRIEPEKPVITLTRSRKLSSLAVANAQLSTNPDIVRSREQSAAANISPTTMTTTTTSTTASASLALPPTPASSATEVRSAEPSGEPSVRVRRVKVLTGESSRKARKRKTARSDRGKERAVRRSEPKELYSRELSHSQSLTRVRSGGAVRTRENASPTPVTRREIRDLKLTRTPSGSEGQPSSDERRKMVRSRSAGDLPSKKLERRPQMNFVTRSLEKIVKQENESPVTVTQTVVEPVFRQPQLDMLINAVNAMMAELGGGQAGSRRRRSALQEKTRRLN